MQLDSYTLLIACCGLLVIFGAAYVMLWVYDRRSHWLLWWGLPLMFNGVALTLYTRVGWQTDFMSIAFGNAARIFGLGCMWYGIRLFSGRRPPWGTISGIALLWIALCLYPPYGPCGEMLLKVLIHTDPASRSRATRCARVRSLVCTKAFSP